MPLPQVATSGLPKSIPAASNAAFSASPCFQVPSALNSAPCGRLREPGIWPGATPGRGSRSSPVKRAAGRSEEHTSELQSLMRISYAVFCLKKKNKCKTKLLKMSAHEHITIEHNKKSQLKS